MIVFFRSLYVALNYLCNSKVSWCNCLFADLSVRSKQQLSGAREDVSRTHGSESKSNICPGKFDPRNVCTSVSYSETTSLVLVVLRKAD